MIACLSFHWRCVLRRFCPVAEINFFSVFARLVIQVFRRFFFFLIFSCLSFPLAPYLFAALTDLLLGLLPVQKRYGRLRADGTGVNGLNRVFRSFILFLISF